ncbi:hypothetical protein ACH470_41785 [Streptomyces bottropensis]|uniref:hypothetical protein n=1 Tax=Streptomyces bottropensis TaxID=42235 RepID=UPI0037876A1A
MSTSSTAVLAVLAVTVALIVAVLAAAAAGFLAHTDGATLNAALTRAGITFAATLSLEALVASTVTDFL